MNEYLIDVPTLTSVWVTANSAREAIEALRFATKNLEIRIDIGTDENPIELIDFTCRGEPEIISGDEEEEEENCGLTKNNLYIANPSTGT